MIKNLHALILTFFLASTALFAQVGSGSLQGTITDGETGEPLPFANILVESEGVQAGGASTDFDGKYTIKPISAGKYAVKVQFIGYKPKQINDVIVRGDKITFLDIKLDPTTELLEEFEVVEYKVPLIDKDGGSSGGTVSRDDIAKMPGRSAQSIATTVAGVSDANGDGNVSVRGARNDGTVYYIDGIKVRGSTNLPKSAYQEVSALIGGVPANYGDAVGGIISITTRGASRTFFGGVDILTSGAKVGDEVYGLDKYASNNFEAYLSGPLLFKKDSAGNKTDPLLGFFISGNYRSNVDRRPVVTDLYKVKDEVRDDLLTNPIRLDPQGTGVIYNSDFLRSSDLEKIETWPNVGSKRGTVSGKLDVTASPNVNLTFGGSFDFLDQNSYSFSNLLLNSDNNQNSLNQTYRAYARFTQRFTSAGEESSSAVKNAFYSIMVDYSNFSATTQDQGHQDNVFNYGYLGEYKRFFENSYEYDAQRNAFIHNGFQPILVEFTESDVNSDLAAITSQYFRLFDQVEGNYDSFENLQAGNALLNGQGPNSIYSLWSNVGSQSNLYQNVDNSQFSIRTTGSADIGGHAVQLGIEYEQRTDRAFQVGGVFGGSPGPISLWTNMRQLANFHISELDTNKRTVTNRGTDFYYTYERLIGDDQTTFDRNLRIALGLDPNGNDFINVDELDPSLFSLDFFSPDELFNSGQTYVQYYGYDHAGNKTNSRPSFNDFFNETDENGNFTRPIAPFEPIYVAGFIMDKFAFDDIVFNVGLRIDRYDANQKVLKDPYLMRSAKTAGEVDRSIFNDGVSDHPTNIGDGFVVYGNDPDSPTEILGYRNGDTWYSSNGEILTDATTLRGPSGIAPILVGNSSEVLSPDVFEDYTPQVILMPRISFSFPISDEAAFYAHYDILTQRPTPGISRLDPTDYFFIQQRNIVNNNPNLKPSKTIDYELGFQQVLSKSSSLKISVFYREARDQVQLINVSDAYPSSYQTYGNIDFSTTKGISLQYDLRRTGNVWVRASYTLQFAAGSGSDNTTAQSLINAGQPNLRSIYPLNFDQRHRINATLDYRYGQGKDYNGPMLGGKQILRNTGANIVANLGSGTPYSAQSDITGEASFSRIGTPSLEGTVNGSRKPAQFTADMQVDRDIKLSFGGKGEGEKPKSANLNVYVLVNNLFNSVNVINVYRFTGNGDDDGYLDAAEYQPQIQNQTDEQSYRELYRLKVNNPFNFGQPRTIRLGIKLDF